MKNQKFNDALSYERALELFAYNPETGLIRWKDKRKDALSKFCAGCVDSRGYIKLKVDGVYYGAHRVVWLLSHGKWPDNLIDHINQNKADNRIANLRDVTQKQNLENVGQYRKVWKKGAALHKPSGLWHATLGHNYKSISLGYFKTEADAQEAYINAKRKLHSCFTG